MIAIRKMIGRRLCIVFSIMLCIYVFLLTNRERKQRNKPQRFSSQIKVSNQRNLKFGEKGNDPQQNQSTTVKTTREEDIVNLTSKIPMATLSEVHINRAKELRKSFGNNSDSVKWFFTKRNESITNFRYDFLYTSNTTCSEGESPFLTILCLTQVHHVKERETIRATWASVVRSKHWPRYPDIKDNIKFVFVFGRTDSKLEQHIVDTENKYFGDIIQGDFKDTYKNLTIKVLMGLRWSLIHCPGTKYVLKVDEDTFIHVANLVNFLKAVDKSENGIVIGWVWVNARVVRHGGKSSIPNDIYPFERYPKYTAGCTYIISGNIIGPILDAAEYLPTIINEDAFITGVARTVVGAEIQHSPDFILGIQSAPRTCRFQTDHVIAATNTNVNLKKRIWAALNTTMKRC